MSVIETDKIDAVGLDKEGQRVFLSIIDSLMWDGDNLHLFTLQEKINSYLFFIESGELQNNFPDALTFTPVIELILRYAPSDEAIAFFDKTMQILLDKGIIFVFGPQKGSEYV